MLLRLVFLLSNVFLLHDCFQDESYMPPKIRLPKGPRTIYEQENATFDLHCLASGLPSPKFEWKRGEIGDSKTLSKEVSFDSNSGVLNFKRLSQTDEGDYRCYAFNYFNGTGDQSFAVSISPPLTVLRIAFKHMPSHAKATVIEGLQYHYIRIPCLNVVAQSDLIVYHWFDSSLLNPITMDERMYIDIKGTLHISYLLQKDKYSHPIACGVSRKKSFTHPIVFGNSFTLSIAQVYEVPTIAPQIEYSENVSGEIYHTANLECIFSGYDPQHNLTISWLFRDGQQILSNNKYRLQYGNRSLLVQDLVEEDEGKYFCLAKLGSKTSRHIEVFLTVTSKPIFIDKAPNDITVIQGKDVTIPCKTRSARNRAPPLTPIWFINGQKLGPQKDTSKFIITDDSLTVKSVKKPKDIMCIACVVSNTYGQTMGQACLNVLLPINVTQRPKEEIVIDPHLGGVLNFTVTATTDASQKLSFKWLFFSTIEEQSSEGALPNFTYYNDASNVALINLTEIVKSDYTNFIGSYLLNLSNFYEFRLLEVRVMMKPQSHAQVLGTNYWIIGLVIGILTFIGAIMTALIIIWRKQRKGDYNVDKRDRKAGLDPENELKACRFSEYSRPGCSEDPDLRPNTNLVLANIEFDAEDNSLSEYSNDATTHFNENGSFIGTYR